MKLKPNKMQQTLGFRVREPVDWEEVKGLLDQLYAASGRLGALFPGRKFTLDGHLVGSVGEVIAAYLFDLDLARASSQGHDAFAPDRRQVEIKLTQGNSVAIRHEPEHLVVLQRPKGGPICVVYNGPGAPAWNAAGKIQTNGQRPISLKRLAELDRVIGDNARLPLIRTAPV
jgi:hypothetical protein